MDRRKTALAAAAAGTVAGVVGLGVLAMPAGAGPAPSLPPTSAEQLVQSVLTAKPTAMNGTVEVNNQLGLPALPGLPQAANGTTQARVWSDGQHRGRLSLPTGNGEQLYVEDGNTLWQWDSTKKTVTKSAQHPDADRSSAKPEAGRPDGDKPVATDPATAAKELVAAVQKTSTVAVDGTGWVAGRPAYELVLTPKPTERTLLREVRVAVDSELRMPLELSVLANGSTDPALRIGFTQLSVGPQDPALFQFTPPPGATVQQSDEHQRGDRAKAEDKADAAKPTVVGDGWDTVLISKLPAGSGAQNKPQAGGKHAQGGQDPMALVQRFGTPTSGPWGSGWLFTTKVGTALVTSDGRFAAGAVPAQVLTEAIGNAK
jgi:outer membrane lipoprotein-sorting protein